MGFGTDFEISVYFKCLRKHKNIKCEQPKEIEMIKVEEKTININGEKYQTISLK